jgi:hypothetical protein
MPVPWQVLESRQVIDMNVRVAVTERKKKGERDD